MPEYRGAVLIIGSLWWDTLPIRVNWRNSRLDGESKQTVYAPIRYGKKSRSWGDTYTMVFSQLCYRNAYGLGTALLIPFRRRVRTVNDLIDEASELWKAEAKVTENPSLAVSASWGAVGLSAKPNGIFPKEILQGWINHYQGHSRHNFEHLKTEEPAIENGLLNMRWLKDAHKNNPVDFDFILATATQPTLDNGRYPSAKTIADAWHKDNDNNIRYLYNNQSNDITTFQDELITRLLESQES